MGNRTLDDRVSELEDEVDELRRLLGSVEEELQRQATNRGEQPVKRVWKMRRGWNGGNK